MKQKEFTVRARFGHWGIFWNNSFLGAFRLKHISDHIVDLANKKKLSKEFLESNLKHIKGRYKILEELKKD